MHLESITRELQNALDHFDEKLKTVRTGRAQPGLIEGLKVEAYGNLMDIKSLASVTVTDSRTLLIDPWDKSIVQSVEKAIRESPIGLNPISDGKVLRINVPQPTEETRKEMVKLMRSMSEETRIAFRHARDNAKTTIIESEKKGEISEDERFRLQEQLDVLIKRFNDFIEERVNKKEQEIMSV